jgi:hypothetical protein
MGTDRDFPIDDPRAVDFDGSSQTAKIPPTSRDLPVGHPRAVDNPKRNTAPEESYAWVTAYNPPRMHPKGYRPPPPPGQPTGMLPAAATAATAEPAPE